MSASRDVEIPSMAGPRKPRSVVAAVILALLLGAGCDWYGDDVSMRPLPYPYDAAIAVHEGTVPAPLAHRGITFIDDQEDVRTAGQNAACSLVDRGRQLWESVLFLLERKEWRGASFFGNRLLESCSEDAGPGVYSFKTHVGRLALLGGSMPPDVMSQIAAGVTYELTAKGGVMVLGTPAGPGPGRSPFRMHAPVARHIEAAQSEGRVREFELGELLAYDFVRRYLVWNVEQSDGWTLIEVEAVDDGLGGRWIPTLSELSGITFYTPSPERTRVLLNGSEIPEVTPNAPDRTRRGSVTIGLRPREGRPDGGSEEAGSPKAASGPRDTAT
jgi:hypothetical protein